MPRSDAQKNADKKYAEKTKGKHNLFAVNLKTDEYREISSAIEAAGMTKADFVRWAYGKLLEISNPPA